MHNMWERVRRAGKLWWREAHAPARPAARTHELEHDAPVQVDVVETDASCSLQQSVQHKRKHHGFAHGHTFTVEGSRTSEAQGAMRDTRSAG